MPEISIAICDDLAADRTNLANMVHAYAQAHGFSARLHLYSSGERLLAAFQRPEPIHLLFLDIYLPGLPGMETARRIRSAGNPTSIVFVTVSREHGMESFEVQAFDYLVKPLREADVSASLDWYFSHIPEHLRELSVYSEGGWQQIPLASIRYIDVYDHRSYIHTPGGVIPVRRGLGDLESAIGSRDFLRCHWSYLVNIHYVEGVEGQNLRMKDQTLVPISATNTANIRRKIIDWIYMKAWSQV